MSPLHFSHSNGECRCEMKAYWIAFSIGIAIFFFQLIGAYLSGSVALLADTFHVFIDSLGHLLAIWTAWMVATKNYAGKRVRAFSSFISCLILLATAALIFREAGERMVDPIAVKSHLLLLFAIPGAVANGLSMIFIFKIVEPNITKTALMRHIGVDLGQSLVVILAGLVLILKPGWNLIDPILSLVFAAITVFLAIQTALSGIKLLNN
ncbi:MAG: cation transporter [Candidatus Harrisonbacteria bacterium]|nr:cation transporter [Candidatus Harrisonbacteria bacterium]